jgi:hypothetical protein
MKQKLFNLLPLWFKELKHADKYLHAILGTLFYVILSLFIQNYIALIATIVLGILVEIYDKISKKGTPDALDAIATFTVPILIFLIFLIFL